MSYDAAKDVYAIGDGLGGVTLVARPALQRALDRHYNRTRTRDAEPSFLPSSPRAAMRELTKGVGDQGAEEEKPTDPSFAAGKVIAYLDPPPSGQVYSIEEGSSGVWAIVLVDDDGTDTLTGNNTVDRTNVHQLHFPDGDPSLKRQNAINRRYWSRDRHTRDQREMTLFRHFVSAGERLRLDGPDTGGGYSVVLVSDGTPDIIPPRRVGDGDRSGYVPGSMADALRQQNNRNREFWRRK